MYEQEDYGGYDEDDSNNKPEPMQSNRQSRININRDLISSPEIVDDEESKVKEKEKKSKKKKKSKKSSKREKKSSRKKRNERDDD